VVRAAFTVSVVGAAFTVSVVGPVFTVGVMRTWCTIAMTHPVSHALRPGGHLNAIARVSIRCAHDARRARKREEDDDTDRNEEDSLLHCHPSNGCMAGGDLGTWA